MAVSSVAWWVAMTAARSVENSAAPKDMNLAELKAAHLVVSKAARKAVRKAVK